MPSMNKFIWTSTRQRYEPSLSWNDTFGRWFSSLGTLGWERCWGGFCQLHKESTTGTPLLRFLLFALFFNVPTSQHLFSTSSFLAPVLLGEAKSLPQRTWDTSQHQVYFIIVGQRWSSLKDLLIPDCWKVSFSASCASSPFSRLLKLLPRQNISSWVLGKN